MSGCQNCENMVKIQVQKIRRITELGIKFEI